MNVWPGVGGDKTNRKQLNFSTKPSVGTGGGEKRGNADTLMVEKNKSNRELSLGELHVRAYNKSGVEGKPLAKHGEIKNGSKFKRLKREGGKGDQQSLGAHMGKKRQGEELEAEKEAGVGPKKARMEGIVAPTVEAGLSE